METIHPPDRILREICILKIILILLVIIYHSFCPFIGSPYWPPIMDNAPYEYFYIAQWSGALNIEAFTLISGYICGYQIFSGKHKISFKSTVIGKAKRLLIPLLVFSFLYILTFSNCDKCGLGDWVLNLLNGAGHLWFLPMLFWCFVGLFIIEKLCINYKYAIILLLLASTVSIHPLPFRISDASYFMLFFYMGYLIKRMPFNIEKYAGLMPILGSWLLFIVCFALNLLITNDYLSQTDYALLKTSSLMILLFIKFLYSFWGTYAILLTSIYVVKKGYVLVTDSIIKLSKYTFGIYILHEFIIKILYYKISICQFVGTLAPFLTVIISFVLSILIVHYSIKCRIGKILLS